MGSRRLFLLAIISINSHYGILRACEVTVNQKDLCRATMSQGSVTLSCQITQTSCSGDFDMYWFRFLASRHDKLDTTGSESRFTAKKSAFNATLKIKGLQMVDSGIYICGIAFKDAIATGSGTTLVVTERETSVVTSSCIVLIVLCILLLVYSAVVFIVYGHRSKWKQKYPSNNRSHLTEKEKRFTSQRIFQAIAQEYHKRYPRKKEDAHNEVRDDDTIYQNT